jgi:phosphatidylglycerol:prolipoprotein diacylglycerol transferase
MSTPLIHPGFDPIAIAIGPVAIHWYGLMYLLAFGSFLWLGRRTLAREGFARMGHRDLDDLLFLGVIGVLLGGRLGYVFFYKPEHYLVNPLEALFIWEGGMAFHGGLLGVIVAMAWFARSRPSLGVVEASPQLAFGDRFLMVADFVAPLVPIGLAFGRLGNYINAELWGRVADPAVVPWAMVFAGSGSDEPRHPSQLYQFALEGLLLFFVLQWLARRPRPVGFLSGVFLVGYGVARFVVEFFREPDAFLGLLALGWSMGQWLSLPMVLLGFVLVFRSARRTQRAGNIPTDEYKAGG